jgi:hypothetical protein
MLVKETVQEYLHPLLSALPRVWRIQSLCLLFPVLLRLQSWWHILRPGHSTATDGLMGQRSHLCLMDTSLGSYLAQNTLRGNQLSYYSAKEEVCLKLETLSQITVLALHKTGTQTHTYPFLFRICLMSDWHLEPLFDNASISREEPPGPRPSYSK